MIAEILLLFIFGFICGKYSDKIKNMLVNLYHKYTDKKEDNHNNEDDNEDDYDNEIPLFDNIKDEENVIEDINDEEKLIDEKEVKVNNPIVVDEMPM